jgi:hypothetical protein
MSTVPNMYGAFLSSPPPFCGSMGAYATSFGTWVKPGGRIAAYVRSTGAQDGDDYFAASGSLVSSINEGLKRCRSGQGDVVFVLPGHTETHSTSGAIWPNLVAGAQIVGLGRPGASNNPTVTLSHTGASLALGSANVAVTGLNVASSTAALTAAVSVTAAGVSFSGNYVAFTGALGANPPVAITGAADCHFSGNVIIANSTDPVVEITNAATTNLAVLGNLIRQVQGTSGGAGISVASTTGISGWIAYNLIKTATDGTPASLGVVIGANAASTVGSFQNFAMDGGSGGSGLLSPAVGS